jgi:hypothetical protein
MKTRTKLCFLVAASLFVSFGLGISERGQQYLIGTPSVDHWRRDDQYMGAGLAPYAYCLIPALLALVIGIASYLKDIKRR